MAVNVLMPALSPTMEEGKLARWLKKEGDEVKSGDILAEIETDKATMEVEAVDEGILAKIIIPDDSENVAVNSVIAIIKEDDDSDDDIEALLQQNDGGKSEQPSTTAKDDNKKDDNKKEDDKTAASKEVSKTTTVNKGDRIFASPLAKRIAAENKLDLKDIKGSGPHGRIIKKDVLNVSTKPETKASEDTSKAPTKAAVAANLVSDIPHSDTPNSSMRKTIASRLLESKQTVPHYYVSIDCQIDELLSLRKTLNANATEGNNFKVSVNDMIIKAVALALKEVPQMNVAWSEDFIRTYEQQDIAVAVATPSGLITPIIKNAAAKGLSTISGEMKDLAVRAKEGKLAPNEYQGGTFTISNLGMFGTKSFQAIVNPPHAGILAIGAGEQQPVVKDGAIAIATVMNVTLSADHRATDGAVGALFIKALKQYIENPLTMML